MPGKVVSLRLPEELLDWATAYAKERGVARSDLLVQGLQSFREDCEAGVPEIRRDRVERAKAAAAGAVRPASEAEAWIAARQAKLNADALRARR